MYIYIFNVFIFVFFSFICLYKFKFNKTISVPGSSIYLGVILFLIFFITAFRSISVGTDTAPYSRIFEEIGSSNLFDVIFQNRHFSSPVYTTLLWCLHQFSSDPQILTIVSSLIITFGLFNFINKASNNVVLSYNLWIALALLYESMNGNRQCIALVIMLNALYYLSCSFVCIKGWLLIFFAIGIHSSSLFLLISLIGFFIEKKIKSNLRIFIASAILSILFYFCFTQIIYFIVNFFPKYNIYIYGNSPFNIFRGNGGGRIVLFYVILLLITILWGLKNRNSNDSCDTIDHFNRKILFSVVFGCIFGIFNASNELINRLLWFYNALFITFIPSTINKYYGHSKKIITFVILFCLYIYSFFSLIENKNGVIPYNFFWE